MLANLFHWVSAIFLSLGYSGPESEYYVEVPLEGPESLRRYTEQGFDVGGVNFETQTASLIVKHSRLSRTAALPVRSVTRARLPDAAFKNHAEVERAVFDLEAKYPNLVRVESIGKSVDGRDIWAVLVTARLSVAPKTTVLFDAMHHAREVMTTEVALDILDYLTSRYETDQKVRTWVNRLNIWVIPMLNPDGNDRVWNQESMWRKNTAGRDGVDINRNYTHAWNTCGGSSGDEYADDYRGPSPGSEPETQAIMDFVGRVKPKLNISYHSFSEIVIYPYGCRPKKIEAPDAAKYWKLGDDLARKLVRDSGAGTYVAGTSYELLYNVDGGSVDWMWSTHKVMSFVVEVNSSQQGFQPSYAKWRDSTVQRQRAGWQFLLDQARRTASVQ